MKLTQLFEKCLSAPYTHTENAGDFYLEQQGGTLTVYLQHSDGAVDWKNNLDFPAKAYKREGELSFFAHRGFLRVWQSVAPYLATRIKDPHTKNVVTVGYSHGAALAVLCHEYVFFERPDLRTRIEGYGFGCPRVLWGIKTPSLARRFASFTVVRNLDDAVTHLPPAALGYFHVGKMLAIGERGRYSAVDAHRPENILVELARMER